MSNPYDSMAGGFSSGKTLGEVAFVSSLVACSVWPELLLPIPADKSGIFLKQVLARAGNAINKRTKGMSLALGSISTIAVDGGVLTSVPMRLKLITTDTGKMLQACSQIHESGNAGHRFHQALDEQAYSVTPEVWKGNDQEAFSKKLENFRNSVQNTYCLAWETAALTAVVATLRFVQLAISAALAGVLAALAVAFWAIVFIPFCQGAATTIRTIGSRIVPIMKKTIQLMDEIMCKVGLAHCAIVVARTAEAGISDRVRLGEGHGLTDLAHAGVDTIGDLAKKLSKGHINISGF